jgi:2-oxoglutarate/2-oxoacid ferredoxin oxidoreductase subunit beta
MPGLVPGIHDLTSPSEDVDGRDKPGHDGAEATAAYKEPRVSCG